MSENKQIRLIYFLLAALTLAAFAQVYRFDFINYDDPHYVIENTHIQTGISTGAIRWAFTAFYAANWHPVTWMSHMLDVRLFGLNPGLHHLTNLLFHLANTLLLFFLFHRMTKAPWQSAFVAALFAIHPLHVQSVAWVSERKDVLSTFFWMLALGAYIHYAERPGPGRYPAVLAFFALGLMAKPMLVTLPFVLLVLDYWPLQRFGHAESLPEDRIGAGKPAPANKKKRGSHKEATVQATVKEAKANRNYQPASVRRLILEKTPLIALAALSSVITFIAQQKGGAITTLKALPLGVRIAGAFVSYVIYIGKAVWPNNLAVLYPHPGSWPLWQTLGSVLLLSVATLAVIRAAKTHPYLPVGWLWFTGTLAPVIGLVQVGAQAVADRYTYIPLIGLFVMAAWGVPELLKKWRYRKEALAASSFLVISCFFVATWVQVGYWKNSIALFDHTLDVTSRNSTILMDRGYAYFEIGDYEKARRDFDSAIAISPKDSDAYNNRAEVYAALGDYERALSDCDRAVEIDPRNASPYITRAAAYGKLGNYGQAVKDLDRAVELDPELAEAYFNRGVAYSRLGNQQQAISDYGRAVEINPMYANAFNNRGNSYAMLGNHRQAILDYDRAIAINPGFANLYLNRSASHGQLGEQRQAIEDLQKAAGLGSEDAKNSLRSRGISW